MSDNPFALENISEADREQPRSANPFALTNIESDRARDLRTNLTSAVKVNPDQAATAAKFAKQYAAPPDALLTHLRDVELQAAVDKADERLRTSPKLAQYMREKKWAAQQAHDDIEPLAQVESGIIALAASGAVQGVLGVSESIWRTPDAAQRLVGYVAGLPEKLGLPTYLNPIRGVQDAIRIVSEGRLPVGPKFMAGTTDVADRIGDAQDVLAENPDTFGSSFADVGTLGQNADKALSLALETGNVSQLGQVLVNPDYWAAFIGQAVPSLALALKSGGSVAFMGWLEGMEQASSAADFEARTGVAVTDAEFAQATLQTAIINSLLEKTGVDKILGANGKGLKGIAAALLTEGTTEALQEFNQNLSALLAYDEGRSLVQGVVQGFMGGAGAGGGMATGRVALETAQDQLDKRQRQGDEAKAYSEKLQGVLQTALQSKLRERNPETFQQLVQEMAEQTEGTPTSVYIDAQVLAQAMPVEQLAEILPSVAEQMEGALAANSMVEVAIGEALAVLPGTPLEQVFLQNARATETALSLVEAAQQGEQAAEFLRQDAERVLSEALDQDAWRASADVVRTTVMSELTNAGRFNKDVNEVQATLASQLISVLAHRQGMTPEQFYARYPLRVAGQSQAPISEVLNTGRTGAMEVEAYHYSKAERPVVSTGAFGTGLQGSGREQYLNAEDKRLSKRAYFYVDKGTGINPEAGVGGIAQRARLRNIYDSNADPLRLKQGREQMAFESAVLDAGFSGYLDRLDGSQSGQVVVLGDQNVQAEVLGAMGATRGEVVPAARRTPAQGRDVAVESILANRDLPAGEVPLATWSTLLAKRMPEVHADLAAAGVFDGEGRVYKDELVRRILETTEAPVYEQAAVERLTSVAQRGERILGTRSTISPAERDAIKASAEKVGISVAEITRAVREHKLAHPPAQGWAPLVYNRTVVDDGKVIHEYKATPYDFNTDKDGKGLAPGTPEYRRRTNAMGKAMTEEVRRVLQRAQAGDKNAQNILAQAGWYKAMRSRLRQEFGGMGDLFADLLGATSPNTPVRDNWANAVDALRRASRGDFDQLVVQWEAWADNLDQLEASFTGWVNEQLAQGQTKKALKAMPEYQRQLATLKEARKIPDELLPTKETGKKYGFNGKNVARAMVDLWRVVKNAEPDIARGGTAPKALNFSGNLIGFRERATIDVWAARMLQRLAGGQRIPSMAETGVSGEMREDGATTLQFGFGQDVFGAAVERIRTDAELRTDDTLANINDDDLQAVVWFVEKELWTVNNWTNAAGEAGSFELEANLTGSTEQARIRELRRVVDSSKAKPDAKVVARAELAALERTVDRFVGGLSIQMAADTQGVDFVPTDADMARLANEIRMAVYEADDGNTVLGSKALSTEGRYGAVERSLDLEVVAREGYDATGLWAEMLRQAQNARQDSTFLSRALRPDEQPDLLRHRPGVEVYFRDAAAAERMESALAELAKEGVEFFTVIVDGRRLSEGVAGAMPAAVGVRMHYVPEFEQRYGMDDLTGLDDVQLAAKIEDKARELKDLAARVSASVDGVSFAGQFWYDTQVAFSHEYQEKIDAITAGTAEEGSAGAGGQVWAGQPVRAGIESANRQLRETASGEPGGDVLGGDAFNQSAAGGPGQQAGRFAPLAGAPSVPGFSGPDPRLVAVAEQYARDNGIELRRQSDYVQVDPERAARIAAAYEAMAHAPNDPAVREAYENLIRQTRAQYDALVAAGYKFWFMDMSLEDNQQYASTPWNAMRDIRANQSMGVYPTNDGFGSSEFDPAANPLLEDTGLAWPVSGPDGATMQPVLANDLFRAVHDAFGHGLEGSGFRAQGEGNAWQAHVRLFTGTAIGAITSETRGQNSWLNYGPNGESNLTAKVEDTVFADQKTGLMPEWTWTEGRVGDAVDETASAVNTPRAGVLEQGPRGTFNPATFLTTLNDNADLTTFQHELGHYAMEVMADLASRSDAPQQIADDMNKLLQWFGVPDLPTWNAMTLEQKRQHHEKFAESMEQYYLEGKAPSQELQPVFRRLRSWFISAYRSLTEFMRGRNLELSDDIRQVFDRMLATDAQIAEAEKIAGMLPDFDATGEAIERLQARSLRDLKWTVGARNKVIKELQAQAKSLRKAVEAEVLAEVNAMAEVQAKAALDELRKSTPEYKADLADWNTLRQGAYDRAAAEISENLLATEGSGLEGLKKGQFLAKNKRRVANEAEAAALKWERENPKPQREIVGSELAVATVASTFGYDSVDAMLQAISAFGNKADVVQGMADQRMLERHGELIDQRAIEEAANEAVHNEARARALATELKAQSDALNPRQQTGTASNGRAVTVNALVAAAKEFAQNLAQRRKIQDLRKGANQHRAAEARAAKRWQEATAKGQTQDAVAAKRDQMLNNFTAKAMLEAEGQVRKSLDYLKKFDKETVRAKLPPEYLDQIDQLLERMDLRTSTSGKAIERRASLRKWVQQQEDAGLPTAIPESLLDDAQLISYKELSLDEFNGLIDAVKNIEHLGRLKNKLLTLKDQREFREIEDQIVQTIVDNGGKARPVDLEGRRGVVAWLQGMWAHHRKLSSLVLQMTGGKDGGPLWDALVRPMNERGTTEAVMNEKATLRLAEIYKPLFDLKGGLDGDAQFIPEIKASLSRGGRLAVLLNWGNPTNRQRVMGGDNWTEVQVQAILSRITPVEAKFANDVWEFIDSFWPEVKAKQLRVSGVVEEKVDAEPFTLNAAGGQQIEMRGGYYPIKYDTARSTKAESQEAAEVAKDMMRGAFTRATTRRGHTKARVDEVNRPVRKSLNVITEHVTQVVHDLAWHEWVLDANRILGSSRVDAAIREFYGPDVLRTMKDTVAGIATADVVPQTKIDQALMALRGNVSRATMGVSFTTALLQPFGLTQSMARIGTGNVLRGVARWGGDAARFENSMAWIGEKSDFMRLRNKTFNREIREISQRVVGKSKALQVADVGLFWLMQKMQLVADVPTWIGAYENALREGVDDATAVARADQAVLDSQGGGQIKDMAEVQRKHPMLTQFYSYFSGTLNLTVQRTANTNFRSPRAVAGWLGDMALLLVIPAIAPALVIDLLRGGGDDDDIEDWAKKLAEWQAGYLLGMVVGARELSGAVAGFDYAGPPVGRIITDISKAAQQTAQGEIDEPAVMAYVRLLGSAFGIPTVQAVRSYRGWLAWDEGEAPASAILFGPPPRE